MNYKNKQQSAEHAKHKKIQNRDKTDRLIARMILGIGLSLAIANGVGCAITHPQISDLRNDYDTALIKKQNYLDDYEKRDEFKNQYYFDTLALNNRLIAQQINGETYDKKLKSMEDNTYTEKVFMQTASEQMKKTYSELYKNVVDTKQKYDHAYLPFLLSVYGTIAFPMFGVHGYYVYNPKKRKRNLNFEVNSPKYHISKESIESVMELKDVPYQGDDYIPNVPRHVDACIINTEEETKQNENIL